MTARWLAPFIVLALGGCDPLQGSGDTPSGQPAAGDASLVRGALSGQAAPGLRRVLAPRAFEFPADHGPHPDHRSEWWYFTGNLNDAAGRRFGFQLTFFRFALAAERSPDAHARNKSSSAPSAWRTRQVWMAHFALTDATGRRFHAFERFARGAAGLAGARRDGLDVWLEDWSARTLDPGKAFPLRLHAAEAGVSLTLELRAVKPLVLQGDRGFSAKSDAPGNASHYYSYTRLDARGTLELDGEHHALDGLAWFDREWSTSALAGDQVGWDWFALHLDDGRDLMFYRLRGRDGAAHSSSAGVLVSATGEVTRLGAADVKLTPGRRWAPASDEARYPVAWRLGAGDLDLDISPVMDAQAHRGRFRYWEGAVDVKGTARGRPISGRGYLEMTPYAAPDRGGQGA